MFRLPLGELAIAGVYLLVTIAAVNLASAFGTGILIWPGNALAAALLVRLPRIRWTVAMGAIVAAGLVVDLSSGHERAEWALAVSCVNALEIGTTAWIFRNWITFPIPAITFEQGLQMAAIFAFAVPSITGFLGGWILHMEYGAPQWAASLNWWRAGAIGSCLCAPPVYLYRTKTARRLLARRFVFENVTLAAFCVVATYFSIRYVQFPFVVMGVPLMVAAFRCGSFGVSVICALCGLLVIMMWSVGYHPLGQHVQSSELRTLGLPFLALVATVLPPIAVGLATDQRRGATRELAAERQRLRTTLKSIADAVITTDAHCRITYLNTAAHELLGQSLEEIENRKLADVVAMTDPRTSRMAQSVLKKCLSTGEVVRANDVILLHRPDGSVRYVTKVATPLFGATERVVGAVVVLRDATMEYERDRKLSHLATHDVLTGLCNRFEFERRVQVLLDNADLMILPATLLVVDLDRFKAVNDGGGHAAGDAVLRRVGEVLKGAVRNKDTVARLGGDEFAVVLEKTTQERARAVAHQIQRALNPLVVEWADKTYAVGASVGVATISNSYESTADWMAAADNACYEAKRAKRGEVRFAATAS